MKNCALNCSAGEDFWESLDFKEIKPVNPKRNQPWIFIGRIDAKAEAPILWPPDVKNGLTGKDPKAGKDWKQEEKGTTEDEMAGWHHRLNGRESEQALGVGDRQGSLGMLQSVGSQESEMTELKWEREVAHLCLTLCNPMDCSLTGSSIHGIFQAQVVEWVATKRRLTEKQKGGHDSFKIISIGTNTVVPQYSWRIDSRTYHRHLNPQMLKYHNWHSISSICHLWLQPTRLHSIVVFIEKNLCICRLRQFKPMLFKGQLYLVWNEI